MFFLNTSWLKTIKSIIFFGLLYFAFGVEPEFYSSNKKSTFTGSIFYSSVANYYSFAIFCEELEEADNELTYFQKLGILYYINRQTEFTVKEYADFIFFKSLIQNHLLNLPPPIIS